MKFTPEIPTKQVPHLTIDVCMASSNPMLAVRNLRKYQHYKDRRPLWIKLYVELLDDPDYRDLHEISKAHLIGLLLLSSRFKNAIPCQPDQLSGLLGSTEFVHLCPLVDAGFLVANEAASKLLADCYRCARNVLADSALADRYQNACLEIEIEEVPSQESGFLSRTRTRTREGAHAHACMPARPAGADCSTGDEL